MSVVPLAALSISGCEASQKDVVGAKASQGSTAGHAADQPKNGSDQGKIVTNEKGSISQQFRSLDEYLGHLERMQGPVDGPWYKEVRPGIYELQTGNLRVLGEEQPKQVFTREELERKFGFSK